MHVLQYMLYLTLLYIFMSISMLNWYTLADGFSFSSSTIPLTATVGINFVMVLAVC